MVGRVDRVALLVYGRDGRSGPAVGDGRCGEGGGEQCCLSLYQQVDGLSSGAATVHLPAGGHSVADPAGSQVIVRYVTS